MANKLLYPEVSFTEEWREGVRFEKEAMLKVIDRIILNGFPKGAMGYKALLMLQDLQKDTKDALVSGDEQ